MLRRALGILLATLGVFTVAGLARATITEAMDLRALVRDSDHVVLATVISTEARYDHLDRIVTDATLRVDERMWGPAREGSTVVVRRLGGVLGDVGLRVEGEATFEPGERVILFARTLRSEGVLRPVGMSQGVLPVRTGSTSTGGGAAGGEVVMPGGDGLALVRRGEDGRLASAPGAISEPTPLDALLARIRDLVAEIHGSR